MCEREREKRREGESKGDRVHEGQVRGGKWEHSEACREEELREGNYKGGL